MSNKILVIAEKPSMGKDIAAIIEPSGTSKGGYIEGNKYIITWAYGHLVGLSLPNKYTDDPWNPNVLPILPDRFYYEDTKDPGAKKQLNVIKSLVSSASSLINACDAGREGEAIFRYVVKESINSPKKVQRLWINSLTPSAIKKGFEELKSESQYDNLYQTALCRDRSDWIIGMGVGTPALSYKMKEVLRIKKMNYISIGRVFTPTFAMVCSRYLENKNFVVKDFFTLNAIIEKDGLSFKLSNDKRFDTDSLAKEVIDSNIFSSLKVKEVNNKNLKEGPPLLFDLTSLQQEANNVFGYSASQTLDIAQKLYESKFITYPRTDSRFINEDMKDDVVNVLKLNLALLDSEQSKYISDLIKNHKINFHSANDKKVTDHHAIIPTDNSFNSTSVEESNIYDLILKRTFVSFSENCLKSQTKITAIDSSGEYSFSSTFTNIDYYGFRVFGKKETFNEVPVIIENEVLNPKEIEIAKGATKPKDIYNESTLLKAMSNCGKDIEEKDFKEAMKGSGIGTPATRASTIEKLFTQKLVQRKGKKLIPTEIGLWIYDYIKDLKISNPILTGEWEYKLDLINTGEYDVATFNSEIKDYARELTKDIMDLDIVVSKELKESLNKDLLICPKCKEGTLFKSKKATGCSNWNKEGAKCDFVIWNNIAGKSLTQPMIKDLVIKGKTKKIKGFKSKANKPFEAALKLDNNFKVSFVFN